ncbi:MAG: QVPTGV class sortase B protein-sorting domain-containing protein [Shewanella sp.]
MKAKTLYIVLGIAAAGGAWWYFTKKKTTPPSGANVPSEKTNVIPRPVSEEKRIIKLPDSLLTNTTGNTGVVPPVLSMQRDSIKIGQALPSRFIQSRLMTVPSRPSLRGYILN